MGQVEEVGSSLIANHFIHFGWRKTKKTLGPGRHNEVTSGNERLFLQQD
jgi:hypothetical protein